jgi:mono/diheme cytochrome c family protein
VSPKAKLTVGLLGVAALSGTALGLGVGRPPKPENRGVAAIREESRYPGRALFSERRCVICHGADGAGTAMGPGLGTIMPEYLAAAGGTRTGPSRPWWPT